MPPTINSRVFVEASHGSPERYLLAAMLERAVLDCKPIRTRKSSRPEGPNAPIARKYRKAMLKTDRLNALDWIFHEVDPHGLRLMSFDWCCQQLGYPASLLRKRIRATIDGRLSERALWIDLVQRRPA